MVANTQKIDEVLLRWRLDKSAQTEALQGTKQLEAAQRDLGTSLGALGQKAQAGVDAVQSRFTSLKGEVKRNLDIVGDLRKELEKTGQTKVKPTVEVQTKGGASSLDSLNQGGQRVGAILGNIGASEAGRAAQLVANTAAFTKQLPDLVKNLDAATVSASLAGVAILAVAQVLKQAGEQQRLTLQAELDAQDQYYAARRQNTSEQTSEQIEQLKRDKDLLKEQQNEVGEALTTAVTDAGGTIIAGVKQTFLGLPLDELTKKFDDLGKQVTTNETLTGLLNEGLQQGVFATNDAAVAEKQLLDYRTQTATANAALAQKTIADNTAIMTGTAEQARARLEQLKIEQLQLQAAGQAWRDMGFADASAQIQDISKQIGYNVDLQKRLNETYIPLLDSREKEIAAQEQAAEATQKLADATTNAAEAQTGYYEKLQQLEADRAQGLAEAAAKLSEGLAELSADRQDQLAEENEQRKDQLAKFFQEESNRARQHQLDLLRIRRDGQQAITDAVADGNIRAAIEATRNLKNQIDDSKANFDLTTEQRKQDLAALKKNLSDQERASADAYTKRYNALLAENRKEVDAVNAKYTADRQAQAAALRASYDALNQALAAENALKDGANKAAVAGAQSMLNQMQQLVAQATGVTRQYYAPPTVTLTHEQAVAQGYLERAGGGDTPAHRVVKYNERGVESARFKDGAYGVFTSDVTMFSNEQTAARLFGRAGRGGDSYDFSGMSFPISGGGDPAQIADAVEHRFLTQIVPKLRQIRAQGERL